MAVDQEKFVEELLDRSLKKFSAAGPRAGLEERTVAGIEAAELQQRVGQWRWIWATAMLALVVSAVWLMWPSASHTPATNSEVRPATSSRSTAVVNSPAPEKKQIQTANSSAPKAWIPRRTTVASGAEPRRTTQSATKLPKLEVFPSPAPLSQEEEALLAFVRQTPRDGLVALSQIQQREQEEQEKRMEVPVQMNFNSSRSDVVNTR